MREQNLIPHMGRKSRIFASIIAISIFVLAIALAVAAYFIHYKHPDFEKDAKQGIPTVDESFMYENVNSKFEYSFALAANTYQQEDGSCKVYFTNPETCPYYLQYEMVDSKTGAIYYKSGVLKPGQYVETLELKGRKILQSKEVDVVVYAYEQETWYSAGNTRMKLMLQPW